MRQAAARPQIYLADRVREVLRTPPLCQVMGFGPGLEHEFARRIEDAGKAEFPILRCRGGIIFCRHVSSQSSEVREGG